MNTDDVMKLMPTIGHETQAKIRDALDNLVAGAREEAFCEAVDAIGGLYSTKRSATTNTGEGATVERAPDAEKAPRCPSPAPSASDVPQPVQPLRHDKRGVLRFRENAIVRHVIDWCASKNGAVGYPPVDGPAPSLNELARMKFPREDWVQLAQLIGYSLSGFASLSYVDEADLDRAEASRAPRASTVSVEEMAERLRARMAPWIEYGELTGMTDKRIQALARSALSALSASEAPRGPANGGKDFHGDFHGTLTAAPEAPQPSREDIEWMNAPMGPQPSRAAQLEYTVGCDQCEKPLSKVEHHPSGIIICKECGGDSTRAAQPAPASTPPIRAVAGTSLACAKCGCRWKRHADGSFQLYDADQRPCVECDNAPNSPLRPETPDDAPASTPDEGERWARELCSTQGVSRGAGWTMYSCDLTEADWLAIARTALRLSSSRTPRVDVRRLLASYYGEDPFDRNVERMTAALKSQGVECVGDATPERAKEAPCG